MKYLITVIFFVAFLLFPAYAETERNPSFLLEKTEIPFFDFNRVARDAVIVDLEKVHTISWQITINNDLVYANPNGNAVLRFYDLTIPDKFIEIGMGSQPDEKFWLAVQIPGDTEYVVVHSKQERGWIPGATPILAYTERSGLTVNNGERIVLSNLDIGSFEVASYLVYGMESSTDPPAINSGRLTLEFISGDPAENQLHLFPFVLAGGLGVLVAVLLVTKKRS